VGLAKRIGKGFVYVERFGGRNEVDEEFKEQLVVHRDACGIGNASHPYFDFSLLRRNYDDKEAEAAMNTVSGQIFRFLNNENISDF
jgi:hypothetical protein